ncbi:MAG: hypothetical protein J6X18_04830 [Bacteroidales bacterium]|nr:hypothetical protein [Bacteroidales bacterium]
MKRNREYEQTQEMIEFIKENSVRRNRRPLNEESEGNDKEDIIPITNEPRFGQNVLDNQIENFRKTVSGGAKFADENSDDAESNPLVFYPKSGNLVFSGSIPNLSGLKFQFSLNDVTNAPYIFVDGLALTDDVLNICQKLSGYYKNWRQEWEASTYLLDKLKKEHKKKDS